MSAGIGGVDIRLPMGLMFTIIGAVVAIYGAFTRSDEMYQVHSLGININLIWGIVMVVFGVLMLAMSLMKRKST